MKCPRCPQSAPRLLFHEQYEGVQVDQCSGCKGVWLDEGELKLILDRREIQFSAEFKAAVLSRSTPMVSDDEKKSKELCPKCEQPMLHMNWGVNSGVIVDRCVGHGIWFDVQELDRVQAYHEHWGERTQTSEFKSWVLESLQNEQNRFEIEYALLSQDIHRRLGRKRSFWARLFGFLD